MTNAQAARAPVGARTAWGDLASLGLPGTAGNPIGAWASSQALTALGTPDAAGALTTSDGLDLPLVGRIDPPAHLNPMEPLLVIPARPDGTEPVAVVVIVAQRPELVAPLTELVTSLLTDSPPDSVTLSTSENIAAIRAAVEGSLGSYSRSLILLILGAAAIGVATLLSGLVMFRRKDYGRRRALGASQHLIAGLVVTQTTLVSAAGSIIGSAAALLILHLTGNPLPDADFTIAVAILATTTAALAAVIPALLAAKREPLTELRVP